ncbi:MAG TPA: endopeptidase La, partial [Vicinamibacteria bacterium]|nr:endopeptidase La [Vicinamibacteria bacterium]
AVPILPLRDTAIFPHAILPLAVGRESTVRLLRENAESAEFIGVVTQRDATVEMPGAVDLYDVGTGVKIHKSVRMPDGSVRLVVQGLFRFRVLSVTQAVPYLRADIEVLSDVVNADEELEIDALTRNLHSVFSKVVELSPNLSDEVGSLAAATQGGSRLADFVAQNLPNLDTAARQAVLETVDVKKRLTLVHEALLREQEVLELGNKIESQVKDEVGKTQREYYLREQMKAIQKELGENDENTKEIEELRQKIEDAGMPEDAKKEALREVNRLSKIPPASAEYTVGRTYLDWIVRAPWSKRTEDVYDIPRAKEILEADHYDLEKVKDRILEFLAVLKMKPDIKGPILCFMGPPGVGKTSLGKSIAKALGRKFVRISLGGIRDEAEIRGHRRTYIGALPGQIIQSLCRAESRNPVFMLDEIDKLGMDFRGDPSSALLEVLDPEQNHSFRDHYLDLAFDLSEVLFIATANIMDPVPPALRDRQEVIHLAGYTEEEKIQIAERHLIPRQLENHGLKPEVAPRFKREALSEIIRHYTKEAGLRNVERAIATICRKAVRKWAEGATEPVEVTAEALQEYLGAPTFLSREISERVKVPGVAIGMAWTPAGGDILFVEASKVKGGKNLTLTGQLGDVMKESARAALTWVRAHGPQLGLEDDFYRRLDLHLHVPEGSIPKDGPSAGVTMVTALVSVLTGIPARHDVAMTGEITLTGHVLPIGGVKEKLLAAHRYGIKKVIIPKLNEKVVEEDLTQEIREQLDIQLVSSLDEVLRIVFPSLTPGLLPPGPLQSDVASRRVTLQ